MDKELKFLIEQKIDIKYHHDDSNIFIVNAWIDSIEKEKILVKCIKRLKEFNIPILLVTAGDRPNNLGKSKEIIPEIKNLVDYFIFNEKNEVLPFEKIKELNLNSLRYVQTNNVVVHSYVDFHHDYAVLSNLKKAILYANELGKKTIHYLEYDNFIDPFHYNQTFLDEIRYSDCVLYEYDKGQIINQNSSAFFIFSMKMELALNFVSEIKNLDEHFKNSNWTAEKFLLNTIKKYTNNYVLTKYIDSKKELNTCYLWNRTLLKGLIFYIIVDNVENLYIMFGGSQEHLIEINYEDYNKFNNIIGYKLINIGKYKQNSTVFLSYMGNVFYKKTLNDTFDKYREKNYLWIS